MPILGLGCLFSWCFMFWTLCIFLGINPLLIKSWWWFSVILRAASSLFDNFFLQYRSFQFQELPFFSCLYYFLSNQSPIYKTLAYMYVLQHVPYILFYPFQSFRFCLSCFWLYCNCFSFTPLSMMWINILSYMSFIIWGIISLPLFSSWCLSRRDAGFWNRTFLCLLGWSCDFCFQIHIYWFVHIGSSLYLYPCNFIILGFKYFVENFYMYT